MTEPVVEHKTSYELVQSKLPEAIVRVDMMATIISVDKQTLEMFGWPNESDLVGKSGFDFIYTPDRQKARDLLQKVTYEREVRDLNLRAVKQDGSIIEIGGSAHGLAGSDGSINEIVVILHDSAVQNAGIEQLKEAEEQLSEAQQIAHFGSWVWDIQENEVHWTDEMYHLLGLDPQSVPAGKEVMVNHVHAEDKEKVDAFIEDSLKNESGVLDFRVINPNSEEVVWLHARSKTFYDEAKQPKRVVGTVHDVTHEKEIDRVKTQFLSLASHQLRGPLTTVNWHAEMLLKQQSEGLSDTQKKYIKELYGASKQTVRLTNALLTVSELELGNMPFKPEDLSLDKIANRVLEDYQTKITDKQLQFKVDIEPNLPTIKTDLYLLKTIFHALYSNATNYIPDGGQIHLTVGLNPDQPQAFKIVVSDTGYGIPADQQDKIFTKLFRGANAKAKVMAGSGLDLYIVKLILELNGGSISFVSEENKGSTFTVIIPFVPKEKPEQKG